MTNKSAEASEVGTADDAVMGIGRAVFVCIDHVLAGNEFAEMLYQIELEDGSVKSFTVRITATDPIIELPPSNTKH